MDEDTHINGNGKQTTKVILNYLRSDIDAIKSDVHDIKTDLRKEYVQKDMFEIRVGRLEKLIYGMVGLILVGVLTALLALILRG